MAGTLITAVGMFLLSRLSVNTAPSMASLDMLVVGIGLGLTMQVLVLAVQNDAPPSHIGVATATATFFRSMGGSLGVAIFGAIFASRLAHNLTALPASVASKFGSGGSIQPKAVDALPGDVRDRFLVAFVDALQPVFVVGASLAFVAFLFSLLLKEIPLRGSTYKTAEVTADAAVGGTGTEAIIADREGSPPTPGGDEPASVGAR